jgi:PAS domain-containing protein
MTESMLLNLFSLLPVGYADHKLVLDEAGSPSDLIFLEANSGYEKMTGLSSANFSGKLVSELFAQKHHMDFDWAEFYKSAMHATSKPNWSAMRNLADPGIKFQRFFKTRSILRSCFRI